MPRLTGPRPRPPDDCGCCFAQWLACESRGLARCRACENGPGRWPGPGSVLGCQLGLGCSSVAGTLFAAGRSLPGMSLAFALMAAINGSTCSSATLSYGLNSTRAQLADALADHNDH